MSWDWNDLGRWDSMNPEKPPLDGPKPKRFFLQADLRRHAVRNADVAAFRSRSHELETS